MASKSTGSEEGPSREELLSMWIPILSTWTVMSIITIAVIFSSLVFLYLFRNKTIVTMSQPGLLSAMCVGSLLYLVGVMLQAHIRLGETLVVGAPWKTINNVADWFNYMGVFITDSILFLKLYRAYKVTRFRRSQTVRARHILVPFSLGLVFPMVLCAVDQILCSPFGNKGSEEDDAGNWRCTDQNMITALVIRSLHWGIALLFRLAIFVFAWRVRSMDESIGDTRRTMRWSVFTFTMYVSQITFVLVMRSQSKRKKMDPIVFRQVYLIILHFPTFFNAMAPSIFLVFPRMYLVWYERAHGDFPSHVKTYGSGRTHVGSLASSIITTTRTATMSNPCVYPTRSSTTMNETCQLDEITKLEGAENEKSDDHRKDENTNKGVDDDDRDFEIDKDDVADV